MTKRQERARRWLVRAEKLEAEAKTKYKAADELRGKAAMLMGNGARVPLDDTHEFVIVDQFEEAVKSSKDIVWAHAGARRWKVDVKPSTHKD